MTVVEVEDAEDEIPMTHYKIPEQASFEELYSDSYGDGAVLLPEYDDAKYKFRKTSERDKVTYSKESAKPYGWWDFLGIGELRRPNFYKTTETVYTLIVYEKSPDPPYDWKPITQKDVVVKEKKEEVTYFGSDEVIEKTTFQTPKPGEKDNSDMWVDWAMEKRIEEEREKRYQALKKLASEEDESNSDQTSSRLIDEDFIISRERADELISQNPELFSINMYAADITPDNGVDDWILLPRTGGDQPGFHKGVTDIRLERGKDYTYQQIANSVRYSILKDNNGEPLPRNKKYKVVSIVPMGGEKRVIDRQKGVYTIILKHTTVQVLWAPAE